MLFLFVKHWKKIFCDTLVIKLWIGLAKKRKFVSLQFHSKLLNLYRRWATTTTQELNTTWPNWDSTRLTSGVNFANILRAAFTSADPKRAKKYSHTVSLFVLLVSVHIKAECKMLMKLTTGGTPSGFQLLIHFKIIKLDCFYVFLNIPLIRANDLALKYQDVLNHPSVILLILLWRQSSFQLFSLLGSIFKFTGQISRIARHWNLIIIKIF